MATMRERGLSSDGFEALHPGGTIGLRLMRVAWHVGNRHTPAEITADALYIEEDHVLAEMVRGQGCTATPVLRPFKLRQGG